MRLHFRTRVVIGFGILLGWGMLMDPGDLVGRLTFVAGVLGASWVYMLDSYLEERGVW